MIRLLASCESSGGRNAKIRQEWWSALYERPNYTRQVPMVSTREMCVLHRSTIPRSVVRLLHVWHYNDAA